MTTLRTAAQQALDSINELFAAEQSEGGERGGHIRTPATREHLVRVAQARKALHESCGALRAALAQRAELVEPVEPVDVGLLEYRGNSVAFIHQKMTAYRTGIDVAWDAFRAKGLHPDGKTSLADMIAKYTAPPQQAEPAQGPEGMVEFLADLQRSRTKYPKNRRMFDGLMGEIDELRRAYAGDGDIRAEAFDVAVCAFRIATEGDAGGNARLEQAETDHETRAELAEQQVVQLAEERDHYRNLWQKAQQDEPQPMHPELRKMWEDHFDKCFRAIPVPEQAEPVQMHPSQFAEMIKGKEAMTGIPVYWAEWPNKEES